jgi:hypothetical protein
LPPRAVAKPRRSSSRAAARAEIEGEGAAKASVDELGPPIEEPPEVAFQHGIPVGLPGERIFEHGVIDDRLEDLAEPNPAQKTDDGARRFARAGAVARGRGPSPSRASRR